jgi:hypothetical protein
VIRLGAEEWMTKVGALAGWYRHRPQSFAALTDYLEKLGPSLDDSGLGDSETGEPAEPVAATRKSSPS